MEKSTYEEVLNEVDGPAAVITISREDRLNAFRGQTIEELIHAFKRAWADKSVRGVIFTGAGTRAFCVGGDVKQRAETGDYGPTSNGLFEVIYLHRLIRDVPKPVIAAVNGLAIGGGHVLHVLCEHSFNADTDHQAGLSQMSQAGLDVFSVTDEAREGAAAFAEKRKPDFTTHQIAH